ncbi:MAG: 2-amino-4-hydroxy-6-hydroxymethyldihydropteridine diphosphokinase [Pirellula sp.]|jgi:2-amino-4-hydroxy-6-hydroxymethyldihydropteridine diphosphokinase
MPRSLISLGANLGNVHETMLSASRLLRDEFTSEALIFSPLYKTPAVGGPSGQSDFLNAVVSIESDLSCWQVWDAIKRIENELGRQRLHRWEARRIDIDLILHHGQRIWTPHLKVPHPRMCMRTFVLTPALSIVPDEIDPVTQSTIRDLTANLYNPTPDPIVVICNSKTLAHKIREGLGLNELPKDIEHHASSSRFTVLSCNSPAEFGIIEHHGTSSLKIVCVETPDPESVQWEDYSYPWAHAMGLTPKPPSNDLKGPRYLLPANDLPWALHEIHAAANALSCPVTQTDLRFP